MCFSNIEPLNMGLQSLVWLLIQPVYVNFMIRVAGIEKNGARPYLAKMFFAQDSLDPGGGHDDAATRKPFLQANRFTPKMTCFQKANGIQIILFCIEGEQRTVGVCAGSPT